MIRAIRLELVRPVGESWEDVGPLLRTLAKATPKLLNAAMDAKIAIGVAGRDAVKAKVAPEAKANSSDGLAYQAVLRQIDSLREWGAKKKHHFATLFVPGAMASAISRAACQAYARRDQGRVTFSSERILVRGDGVTITADEKGHVLSLKLRAKGAVRFALAWSVGAHLETVKRIAAKTLEHGDAKLQWDERRKKWYALVSYEPDEAAPLSADPARAIIVHRGVRNALFILSTTGQSKSLPGGKFMAQRRGLESRKRDVKRTPVEERGQGAKGHGRARRYEMNDALDGKIGRVTHTFCQQAAAFVAARAKAWGCGLVLIEDYGGIEPNADRDLRRVLDRFPLHEMKECIASRLERDGLAMRETPAAFVSTTCPRCNGCESANHVRRTGMFRCRACGFERAADWVAAFWMGEHGGADMSLFRKRLGAERELAETIRGAKEA